MISNRIKSLVNYCCSQATLLIVPLALCLGGSTMAQAGADDPLFVGSVRLTTPGYRARAAEGYLLVYSATDEFEDGGLAFYAHSSYSIYTLDGKLFKSVENHMSRSDEIPELVTLPVGSYIVEARSENNGYVRVRVVINAARRTMLELERKV
jgi:hypothetical protein